MMHDASLHGMIKQTIVMSCKSQQNGNSPKEQTPFFPKDANCNFCMTAISVRGNVFVSQVFFVIRFASRLRVVVSEALFVVLYPSGLSCGN